MVVETTTRVAETLGAVVAKTDAHRATPQLEIRHTGRQVEGEQLIMLVPLAQCRVSELSIQRKSSVNASQLQTIRISWEANG